MKILDLGPEVWKDIPGFPGYKASSYGRIKSFRRYRTEGKILSPSKNPNVGYLQVLLRRNGKSVMQFVHRLVALTFCENPENKKYVNHIDENKLNNFAYNLEFVTNSENLMHGYGRFRQRLSLRKYHQEHPGRFCRMVGKYDKETGELLKIYDNVYAAAADNKVKNYKSINVACNLNDKGKTLKGFLWQYLSEGGQPVNAYDLSGVLIETFPGMAAAARALGVKLNGISRCCRGELKTAYGYKFAYA